MDMEDGYHEQQKDSKRSRHHEQMETEDGYHEQQKDMQDDDDMDQSSGAEYVSD